MLKFSLINFLDGCALTLPIHAPREAPVRTRGSGMAATCAASAAAMAGTSGASGAGRIRIGSSFEAGSQVRPALPAPGITA